MVKRYFGIAMLIVGTVIGAGFATGREIISFFGPAGTLSPFIAPAVGVFVFGMSVLFLSVGSKVNGNNISEVNARVAGKLSPVADIVMLVNSFIVLGGMLAGLDSLGSLLLPIAPAYSIVFGVAAGFIVFRGISGLLKCNFFVIPFVAAVVAALCVISLGFMPKVNFIFNPLSVILYGSMNMLLASSVLTTIHGLSKRGIVITSAVAASVISALMLFIILMLNSTRANGEMPAVDVAKATSPWLFGFMAAAVAVSVFTTLLSALSSLTEWLFSLTKARVFSVAAALLAGMILSVLGFETVVNYLYPVIGAAGIAYTVVSADFLFRRSKRLLSPDNRTLRRKRRRLKVKDGRF